MSSELTSKNDMADLKTRLPKELRDWLKGVAKKNVRSMNAEIIFMLMTRKKQEEMGNAQ